MPIAHFHLVDGVWSDEQVAILLERASQAYSTVLESPIERVRTFVVRYRPSDVATGGVRVPDGGAPAPYFTALVLRGRPERQRHELLTALTDVVVEELGCARSLVRGQIIQIDPEDWGIGGRPATQARSAEISARAAEADSPA